MDGGRDATGLGTGADLLIVLFFLSPVFGIGEAYTAPCFCFLLFFPFGFVLLSKYTTYSLLSYQHQQNTN